MSAATLYSAIAVVILVALYLPALVFFYWLTHVRRQVSANRQVIRTKELSFFFMRTLDEKWKVWPQLFMSILPSVVLALGASMAALSLATLLRTDVSTLLGGFSLEAIETYIRPVFFGFLGAYLFMLQTTLRRYLDDDLGIDIHMVITVRVISALIVSFVAGFLLPAAYSESGLGEVLVYGAAFIFGVMPERGFETLYRIVTGWLGDRFHKETEYADDLQACLGFDRVRLARLNVEGVGTADDMAHVEIERLAQKTRFDLQAIFYWVDRAIFCSVLGDTPARQTLERQGIHTFTAFEVVYRDSEARQSVQEQINGVSAGQAEAAETGQGAAKSGDLDLDVVYTAMQRFPNTQLVRLFTNYKAMQVTGSFEAANRAEVYEQMEQYGQAIAEYDLALDRNSLDPTLLTHRGRAQAMYAQQQMRKGHFAVGREAFERALHDFQRALNILPTSWEARLQRAITLQAQRSYLYDQELIAESLSRAVADLQEARKHNAEEPEIVIWLGWAHLTQGEYDKAIDIARQTIRSSDAQIPAHVKATLELVIARAMIAQSIELDGEKRKETLKRAHSHITQAQGYMPRSSLLFLTEALYHYVDSPGSKQEERFLELALEPGEVPVPAGVVSSSFRLHVGEDHSDEIYEMWGQLNRDRGDVRAAIACFTQAIEQNPARATAYIQRGAMYERLGDLDAAIADYDEVIDTLGYETYQVYLARVRAESLASVHHSQFRTLVERDVERAIALAPAHPEPLIVSGDWLRLSGEYAEALDAYDQAEEKLEALAEGEQDGFGPVRIDLNVGRALAYSGLSDRGKAMRALREADRLVQGTREQPAKLRLGWGVYYGMDVTDPESHMNAHDALVQLAEESDWSTVNAADLKQMHDTLVDLQSDTRSLDREAQIRLVVAIARVGASLGEDVTDDVDALKRAIADLADEAQRADLQALLATLDELERFM